MIFNGLLENFECIATLGCMTIIPIILTLPTFSAHYFGTASFLYAIYSSFVAGLLFWGVFKLFTKYKNKDILDIAEIAGGRTLKIFSGLLISLYLIIAAIITLSEFNENVRNILFDEAPSIYISLLFMITVLIGSLIGLKGIFRASTILAPFMIIGFIGMFFALIPSIDLTNFTPLFGNGISDLFIGGAYKISGYESLALLFLIAPNIKNFNKTARNSFFMIAFFLLSAFFLIFGVMSYPSLADNYLPFFELTKLISYGRFIQRVESIFVLLWLIATFIYLTIDISFSVLILKKIFNIKKSKKIIIIACITVLLLSRVLSSYIDILKFREILSIYISPLLIIAYPLAILLLANFKKSRHNKETNHAI